VPVDLLAPNSIDGSFVPRRSATASVELDGEIVLAGGRGRATYYRLDPVASLVWSCFDGSGSADEIAHDLAAELGAPAQVVSGDVMTLTRALGQLCFLEGVACDEGGPPVVQPVALVAGPAASGPRRVVEPPST
jgi:hypothetical protein